MRVIIVAGGREFAAEVGDQEPVIEIKRRIEHFLQIPISGQTLSVCGWELLDGLDIDDYPIVTADTKIDLIVKTPPAGKIQITVKFSSRQINIEIDRTETVRSLKEKIHIMDGTPVKRLSLFFSGIELEDDFRNLGEYGISEFSEIVVFLKTMNRLRDEPPARKLSFVVQPSSSLMNSAIIPVEMKDSGTVGDLRVMLLDGKVLPRDDYLFIHKQRIMRENCSLRWHGVDNGDYLYVFKGSVSSSGF